MYLTFTFLSLWPALIVDSLIVCCLGIGFWFKYYVLIGSIYKSESEHRKSIEARNKKKKIRTWSVQKTNIMN